MTVKLVQIGNSKGIRIPRSFIKETGLGDEVNLRREGRHLIIEPAKNPRAGWEEQIKKVIAEHGNELTQEDREWLDAPLSEEADKDWTW